MKVVSVGNEYRIYDDTLKTMEKFPAMNYIVRFSQDSGFYLEKYSEIEINEKVYGIHTNKVNKVIKNFKRINKNLGVILSGEKGIGKSLFAKMLSIKSIEEDMPVIIVDKYIPGIANYIDSIDQKVMVLFDEFDKTFGFTEKDGELNPQTELLTLFDGISQGKKLFVITCNRIDSLNSYLINRPGRFHYHFRFEYPKSEDIREYLEDKLEATYYSEIDKVVEFSKRVNLNFDCLRSIAFELNTGETFEEAIKDLNIVNINKEPYRLVLHFTDGSFLKSNREVYLDLFSEDQDEICYFYNRHGDYVGNVAFNTSDIIFNTQNFKNIVKGEYLKMGLDDDVKKDYENLKIDRLEINKIKSKSIHYTV